MTLKHHWFYDSLELLQAVSGHCLFGKSIPIANCPREEGSAGGDLVALRSTSDVTDRKPHLHLVTISNHTEGHFEFGTCVI